MKDHTQAWEWRTSQRNHQEVALEIHPCSQMAIAGWVCIAFCAPSITAHTVQHPVLSCQTPPRCKYTFYFLYCNEAILQILNQSVFSPCQRILFVAFTSETKPWNIFVVRNPPKKTIQTWFRPVGSLYYLAGDVPVTTLDVPDPSAVLSPSGAWTGILLCFTLPNASTLLTEFSLHPRGINVRTGWNISLLTLWEF